MQKHFIVIIPGILGSTLVRDGSEIWGLNASSVTATFLSLGRNFKQLTLPEGIGHEDPNDGIIAGRLMPTTSLIPGFWNMIDGYTELVRNLETRLSLYRPTASDAGNLIEFAYDWRLSNQLNGQRLADRALPELERWRKQSGHHDAKLVFICHSMGGLIARWFIEVLGGAEVTDKLITIGTPYRGSVNALESLANGFAPGIGPLRVKLDSVLRSMPSTHQLLPTYHCIDTGVAEMVDLTEVEIPNIAAHNVKEAFSFHNRIAEHIGTNPPYSTYALKGISQPTSQSARITGNKVETIRNYKGKDKGGDGTVPRPSSHPPEWADETRSLFYGQTHGSLQNNGDTIRQLFGILTDHLGNFMGGTKIGVDVPDMIVAGQKLEVLAISEDADSTLPLQVRIQDEQGIAGPAVLMRSAGDGTYSASVSDLAAGAYRVTVGSSTSHRQVDDVINITLVWDAKVLEL